MSNFIPRNKQGQPMTKEEVDLEIERLQQRITYNLQTIDENYAKCNLLITTKMLPAMDKFDQASNEIWERSKVVL